ncbi:MAG: adenylate/guanylate cyclase domain-containing protein [Leptospiraceae bacterium]|nr:adenylate/guanylate cyclase domain-containing protein [Leptospiraceae bacterium]
MGTILIGLLAACARTTRIDFADRGLFVSPPESELATVLNGPWAFYPDRWIDPEVPSESPPPGFLNVPTAWNGFPISTTDSNAAMSGHGYGSYRLRIRLPADANSKQWYGLKVGYVGSAYRLYANGHFIGAVGEIATEAAAEVPLYRSRVYRLRAVDGEVDLVAHVSNFHHSSGGIRRPIVFGDYESVETQKDISLVWDAFLFGSILLMGLYHLGLFLNRHRDLASLYFALFCLLIVVRVLTTGEYLLALIFPNVDYYTHIRLEYLSFVIPIPLLSFFLSETFSHKWKHPINLAFLVYGVGAGLPVLLGSPTFFTGLLPYIQSGIYAIIIYFSVLLIIAIIQHRTGAIPAAIGGVILAVASINDILYASNKLNTGYYAPFGLFLFMFAQSYLLARIFTGAFKAINRLTDKLTHTNQAYSRFVPVEFLEHLNKRDITDIQLGDQVLKEMSVMFSDIHAFTTLSEQMSPAENFQFLNSYLSRMTPIVRKNHGFIDKYIGDAIMGLFPRCPDDALHGAIEMQEEIRRYNHYRMDHQSDPIRVGIGIHMGPLMLGTIGSSDRLESTVISDAVNLAARIERLTRTYGASILISEDVRDHLREKDRYRMRFIDRVRVIGKSNVVQVYEVFEGISEVMIDLREATRLEFEQGVRFFFESDFENALKCMENVLRENPGDDTARLYYRRCRVLNREMDPH